MCKRNSKVVRHPMSCACGCARCQGGEPGGHCNGELCKASQ